jgi:hypothetical protein
MIRSGLAGNEQNQDPSALSLSFSTRAAIKRIELDYRQGRLDSRRAFAGILDSITGNVAGKIPYAQFEVALQDVIPAEAFRSAVVVGIIDIHHCDAKPSAFPSLTLPLLERLQHEYERLFQIIYLCDLAKHPETAEVFIARDLTMPEVRNDLLALLVKVDQEIDANSYVEFSQGTAEASSNPGGLAWSMVGPDPKGPTAQPVDRLREIHARLGRNWDDTEARLWLLSDKLKLADLIRENALEWSERELVRLAAEEDQDGSATSPDTAPSTSEPRRKPGPKPNLEVGRQLAAIVKAHADWKADLDAVCEELDEAGVTAPKRRDGRRYRGWLDALDIGDSSARDRVIKAIEYHLKKPHQE